MVNAQGKPLTLRQKLGLFVASYDSKFAELQSSLVCLGCAIWFAAPHIDRRFIIYDRLCQSLPHPFPAIWFTSLGLIQMLVLHERSPKARRIVSLVSCLSWVFVSTLVALANISPALFWIYLVLAMSSAWAYIRTAAIEEGIGR